MGKYVWSIYKEFDGFENEDEGFDTIEDCIEDCVEDSKRYRGTCDKHVGRKTTNGTIEYVLTIKN